MKTNNIKDIVLQILETAPQLTKMYHEYDGDMDWVQFVDKHYPEATAQITEYIEGLLEEVLVGLEIDVEATRERMEELGATESEILNMEIEADDRKETLNEVRTNIKAKLKKG